MKPHETMSFGARMLRAGAPRVAVIHDWLTVYAGAERVLEEILGLWPEADLYSVVDFLPDSMRGFVKGKRARTTFLQRLPFARRAYRSYLPLMPIAVEQLDLSAYDIVISSCHAVSKGVITGPDTLHVSYVHSPIRYAWDLQHQYLNEARLVRGLKSTLARCVLHYLRMWDQRTANGISLLIANSAFVARRIAKAYGRKAQVIYPPVDVARFGLREQKEDFYLTASRMVPYKKMPLIVEAFAQLPHCKLVVVGDGPEFERVKASAAPNVNVLGFRETPELIDLMQRAKAFVFAAEEDFGIVPLEAQACGTPVIAYGRGGSLETIVGRPGSGRTGVFFEQQTTQAICAAVKEFEAVAHDISPAACRQNALRFSPERFRVDMMNAVTSAFEQFMYGGQVHLNN